MSEKRSASSLGRLLLAALMALAAVSPCHANDQKSSVPILGGMLTAKMDTSFQPMTKAPKMMFGGVSASSVDSGESATGIVDNPIMNDLTERDVYLFVDHTSSMLHEDCPDRTTRWDWLRKQVFTLSENLDQQIKGSISLVPFAQDFEIHPQVKSSQVKSILKKIVPVGSTHPERALIKVFDSYFATRDAHPDSARPLLIVVVSDGVPNEPDAVIDVVTSATARMNDSREILLTFLQIANDQQGNSIMNELDCDLVGKNGARFDIINRKDFREVQSKGLESCLVEAFASNINDKLQILASACAH